MKEIRLYRGEIALVDDIDYARVSSKCWWMHPAGYARTKEKREDGTWKAVLMHNFILGPESVRKTDHKDRNKLNNCRSNLRLCSQSQNMMNKGKYGGSSKFKGVSIRTGASAKWRRRLYRSYIACGNKTIELGHFMTEREAALAYNDQAKKLHGEYACLNDVG